MGSLAGFSTTTVNNTEPYYRIQFYSLVREGNTENLTQQWHSAVFCDQFYKAPHIVNGVDISIELASQDWICPDVTDITVLNNPTLYTSGNGIEFVMIVNDCESATSIDSKHSLSTYATKACETVSDEITSSIDFKSKVLTQDGEQKRVVKNDGMTVPYFADRLKTFLMPSGMGQVYRTNLIKQEINYSFKNDF